MYKINITRHYLSGEIFMLKLPAVHSNGSGGWGGGGRKWRVEITERFLGSLAARVQPQPLKSVPQRKLISCGKIDFVCAPLTAEIWRRKKSVTPCRN